MSQFVTVSNHELKPTTRARLILVELAQASLLIREQRYCVVVEQREIKRSPEQ
jgi:hypothetical protein